MRKNRVLTKTPSPGPTGSDSDSVSLEGPRGLQYEQGPQVVLDWWSAGSPLRNIKEGAPAWLGKLTIAVRLRS